MSAWVGVSETIVIKNARWNSEIFSLGLGLEMEGEGSAFL